MRRVVKKVTGEAPSAARERGLGTEYGRSAPVRRRPGRHVYCFVTAPQMLRREAEKRRILIVDDDADLRKAIRMTVRKLADEVDERGCGAEGIRAALADPPSVMLLDLAMPDMTGIDVLAAVKAELPDLPVIMVSGSGTVDNAVEAMRHGALDFVTKPFVPERLKAAVRNALELSALGKRVEQLESALAGGEPFAHIVGCSGSMRLLFASLRKLGRSSATVLIQGETGVGKDLVARALHTEGSRSTGPFVDVNCAAIPHDLLENELFGHESEAFTGATHRRTGKIETASGGTLFLDEVGELDLSSQAKLLRVLQNRRVERLGGSDSIPVDVRVVAATNRNLAAEVERGAFRADLYYRLSVYPVHVPPLRERREDIPSLVQHFLERAASAEQRGVPAVSREAMELLASYDWPGNARELENVIRRALIGLDGDVVAERDLAGFVRGHALPAPQAAAALPGADSADTLSEVERKHVTRVLELCHGNLSEAARVLGIGRTTLYRKIEKYGLSSRLEAADARS